MTMRGGGARLLCETSRWLGQMRAPLLILAAALAAPAVAAAEDDVAYGELQARYRCPIVDRLERIYATGDPEKNPDEYLIVDMPLLREHYVQCIFYKRGKIYCEAASGYFLNTPGQPRTMHLAADAIAALAALGFSTDGAEGNFKLYRDVAEPPDFGAIADLILKALHQAYGADGQTTLAFHAPYAPRATRKCEPVS
jgi:hypothetical protein